MVVDALAQQVTNDEGLRLISAMAAWGREAQVRLMTPGVHPVNESIVVVTSANGQRVHVVSPHETLATIEEDTVCSAVDIDWLCQCFARARAWLRPTIKGD